MPQVDKVGTAATGFGVVGIGVLAMGIGFGLAPSPAHMQGTRDGGRPAPAAPIIGSPEAPVARLIHGGPLAEPLSGTQAGAVWFKGFRLDRVNEPYGLLRALAVHEAEGRIACSPKLAGKDTRSLMRINGLKCAGGGLQISASLVNSRMASLKIHDGVGGELVVVGGPHGGEVEAFNQVQRR
jgi:hypothetical protein